jgi:hypothetical protein
VAIRGIVTSSKTNRIYATYMHEIKWRLGVIDDKLQAIKKAPDENIEQHLLNIEFSYLQVRFVCELVALAALAAHRSYGLKKELLDKWHADEIFAALEEINEHCFPVPTSSEWTSESHLHFTPQPDRGISRHQLKEIYGRCGDNLHRGFLRHALTGKHKLYNVDDLLGWFLQLQATLGEHLIVFPDQRRTLMVNLTGGADGSVIVLESKGDESFALPSDFPSPQPKPRRPHKGG